MLRVRGARRAAAAQLVIDESTAMAVGQDNERDARLGFYATGLAVFALWNLATLIGALGASAIDDPSTYGLDAAAAAAFVALLAPRMTSRRAWIVAAGAMVVALALTPLVTPGVPVLCAALVAVAVGWREPGCPLMWTAVIVGSLGCYALKLAGLSVPPRVLDDPRLRRIAELLPIALLSALVGTQTFADGRHLSIDARFAGLVVAVAAGVAPRPVPRRRLRRGRNRRPPPPRHLTRRPVRNSAI